MFQKIVVSALRHESRAASFARLLIAFAVLAGAVCVSSVSAQTAPNTVVLLPAPDIAGVIKGGTRPEIVVRGLKAADDPIWVPNIGLLFTGSAADRVGRLGEDDQLTTFVGDLHRPLGMTFDSQGRLISLQSQAGFAGPR